MLMPAVPYVLNERTISSSDKIGLAEIGMIELTEAKVSILEVGTSEVGVVTTQPPREEGKEENRQWQNVKQSKDERLACA